MSIDIKLSKAHISKIIQTGCFLGSLLSEIAGTLMKVALQIAKHTLGPLGITTAASAIDAEIQRNIWCRSNDFNNFKWREMNDIMKIFQALEDSIILLKEIKNNWKWKKRTKRRFLGMLLGTLGAILLGNMFTGKGILRAGCGNTFF